MAQARANAVAIDRRAEQLACRAFDALQVQVESAHATAVDLHRAEVAVVGLDEQAQILDARGFAVDFDAVGVIGHFCGTIACNA